MSEPAHSPPPPPDPSEAGTLRARVDPITRSLAAPVLSPSPPAGAAQPLGAADSHHGPAELSDEHISVLSSHLPVYDPASAPPSLDGYEILGELGRGGMGVVYKARHKTLNRVVALKMILAGACADQEERTRFRTEAEAAARLTHPNIVPIYEIGEQDGRPYFSLEYLDGGTLSARIAGCPRPNREAARIIVSLSRAIQHAHEQNILHRDLKPSNVLLAPDGTPKITDFGLAKILDGGHLRTRTGDVVGTPGYMAPEQAMGDVRRMGPATDVYALGAILYELLTGRPPFRSESPMDTLRHVIEREPAPPRLLNPKADTDLEAVCLKCLEKDPAHRYPSAAALADDLQRWLEGSGVSASSINVLDRLGRVLERRHRQMEDFAGWAGLTFWIAAVVLVEHLALFGLVLGETPEWTFWATRFGMYAVMGGLFVQHVRSHVVPLGPAERQMWSGWVGYLVAAGLAAVCVRWMVPLEHPIRELVRYPLWSLMIGLTFFNMGSYFWGRCYMFGAAFFVLALAMSWAPQWSPLMFGGLLSVCLTAIGIHLRELAAEADGGPAGNSGGSGSSAPPGK